jgi:hypothetical protein
MFEITTQLLNIKNSKEVTDYCRDVAQNNLDMVKVEIERHKIELKEMTSQLK